ncbi:hypothetical protein [Roseburia sp. MSJ-14]|uniref:hypothetical protein n=1 Tax=Roseburia sp. MSJ-14 TaxID=2841514 RepID=UPI001C10EDF7|nr:hypothetical protein [Roseburia sp. MSJ-14]MBU5473600.1 hypothetical protein [Roseburia sp. MSJ-14]
MSLLRTYSFNEIDYIDSGSLWSMFKDIASIESRGCSCTLEVVEAVLSGKLKMEHYDSDGNVVFDLRKYERKVEKLRKLEQARRHKNEKLLLDDYDDLAEGGVVTSCVSALQTEDIAKNIIDNAELQWALKSLDEKLLDFIVIDKVNIKVALLQANKGIPESIQLVKDIVKKYPYMGEIIHIILSCGKPLEEVLEV